LPAQIEAAVTTRNHSVSPSIGTGEESANVIAKASVSMSGTLWDTGAGFNGLRVPVAADLPGFSLSSDDTSGGKIVPPEATSSTKGKTENRCPAGLTVGIWRSGCDNSTGFSKTLPVKVLTTRGGCMKNLFELQNPQELEQPSVPPAVQNSSGAVKAQSINSLKQVTAAALSTGPKSREYEWPKDDIRGMPNKGPRDPMVFGKR
jgi:hypothetical protein